MRFKSNFKIFLLRLYTFGKGNGGFGMNELLGIAAALIVAAFVIIPGLRSFADSVIVKLGNWWSGTIMNSIFPAAG